jgi:hypothetical protein
MLTSISDDKISLILKILNRHLSDNKNIFEAIELYNQIRIPAVQDAVKSKEAIENHLLKYPDYLDEERKESLEKLAATFSGFL